MESPRTIETLNLPSFLWKWLNTMRRPLSRDYLLELDAKHPESGAYYIKKWPGKPVLIVTDPEFAKMVLNDEIALDSLKPDSWMRRVVAIFKGEYVESRELTLEQRVADRKSMMQGISAYLRESSVSQEIGGIVEQCFTQLEVIADQSNQQLPKNWLRYILMQVMAKIITGNTLDPELLWEGLRNERNYRSQLIKAALLGNSGLIGERIASWSLRDYMKLITTMEEQFDQLSEDQKSTTLLAKVLANIEAQRRNPASEDVAAERHSRHEVTKTLFGGFGPIESWIHALLVMTAERGNQNAVIDNQKVFQALQREVANISLAPITFRTVVKPMTIEIIPTNGPQGQSGHQIRFRSTLSSDRTSTPSGKGQDLEKGTRLIVLPVGTTIAVTHQVFSSEKYARPDKDGNMTRRDNNAFGEGRLKCPALTLTPQIIESVYKQLMTHWQLEKKAPGSGPMFSGVSVTVPGDLAVQNKETGRRYGVPSAVK